MADVQGLFVARYNNDPIVKVKQGAQSPDYLWKAWARVESVKRYVYLPGETNFPNSEQPCMLPSLLGHGLCPADEHIRGYCDRQGRNVFAV